MSRPILVAAALLCCAAPTLRAQATPPDSVRAAIAAARSDLRNLITAQEAYFSDHARYASSLEQIGTGYSASQGNSIRLANVAPIFWSAVLTSARLVGSCTVWVGPDSTKAAATERDKRVGAEGVPVCDRQPGEGPPPPRVPQ